MKAWMWIGLAAAAVGAWWWYRRQPGARSPFAFLDPPSPATAPGYYAPPIPPSANPSAGGGWKGDAAKLGGVVGAAGATAGCVAASLGPLCVAAAPVGNVVGTYATKGAIAVGGYAVDAAKATGSAVKTGLKAIIPGW